MNDIHRHTPEARAGQKDSRPISESRLITLGGIMGLVAMPGRHSGQRLADAVAEADLSRGKPSNADVCENQE